ncbi:glycoside hydrolase family 2 protein [Halobacillus yeomjeoni]|uniref:Beta galactosidase jelly roll domain-containing protein n=1 Tax=Halobacillus yeomjeoni TaxID=311194 RepID=A0A931HX95_9BACI|nr:sugar-binding domain-containing protein [Halobacillus yeomjeoni]MBH0231350.1 beta galactosidase jelly roll domain-containing protein [Halobacillus yeomjeoni]
MIDTKELPKEKESQCTSYPRPQFRRDTWIDLNGTWLFQFDDEDKGEQEEWFKGGCLTEEIQVPYVYQSEKSEVEEESFHHRIVWYEKNFEWEPTDNEMYLHFEAVDYSTKVWVNGQFVGDHEGGHTPFSFQIRPSLIEGENTITVRIQDDNDVEQPIGKQSWKSDNFLCWYTRTTGIWQPVWLEEVSPVHLERVRITPKVEDSTVEIQGHIKGHHMPVQLEAEVFFNGEWITTAGVWVKPGKRTVDLKLDVQSDKADFRVFYWSPDTPNLYDLQFKVKDRHHLYDQVQSYFGMRSIETKGEDILLNRERFYQRLILDQGYYAGSLMTASYEQMEQDLIKVKEMGFNGVRRHQTIADRRYMEICDRLGLVMWAEMPSSFLFSTTSMTRMMDESREMIEKHYNHPSVIIYTLMNESWGVNEIYHQPAQQNFVNALYYQAKSYDPTRLIVGNDGWEHTLTDILTIHDYNSDPVSMRANYQSKDKFVDGSPSETSCKQNYARGYHYNGEPVMISEYGGIAYGKSEEGDWGYGSRPETSEEVLQRLEELTKVIHSTPFIQGFCYTQLTDVEQEVNGLLDHNHEYKFDPVKIKEIIARQSSGFVFE